MLAEFQQALADLVAAPERCQTLRDAHDPGVHLRAYDLTPRERDRLVAIARHDGMSANCTVYRSNRLTPIVLNLPDTCAALGPHFRSTVDRFWASHPTENFVHFLVESARFAGFLTDADLPDDVAAPVRAALAREGAVVRARLAASVRGG